MARARATRRKKFKAKRSNAPALTASGKEAERQWKLPVPKRHNIAVAAILVLILANALYYGLTHYEGASQYGDDVVYLYLGSSVAHGVYTISSFIFSVRLMEAFPIGVFYTLFGVNDLSSTAWNLLSYVGIIIVTFLIGRFLYNNKAGLLSAFLVSIFPLVTKYAVNVGEDIPLAFLGGLAVLFFLHAERNGSRWYYLMSGVLLVAVWLTSYEGAIVIAFVFLYAIIEILRKKIQLNREPLFFIFGIVIAFLITFIYSQLSSNCAFCVITTNTNFYSAVAGSAGGASTIPSANTDLSFYIQSMFQYGALNAFNTHNLSNTISYFSNQLFGQIQNSEYGLYFYALVPAAALLLAFRERRSYFLVFWFLFSFLFLEFGPMHVGVSLNPPSITYLLAHRLLRFMLVAAIPLCCIIGIGLAKLLEFRNKILVSGFAVAVVLLFAMLYANNYFISNFWYLWEHYPEQLVMQAVNFIKPLPMNTTIYLEGQFNNANVGYSASMINTYLGDPLANRVNYSIAANVSCSSLKSGSYIIWSGPPKCPNWSNALNITVPKDIPSYVVSAENPNLNDRPTNVYRIN
ncbi:MAG: glycosyltransferase family 39 protein [Candidatus Micrarchaeota archaeon]|nr:glycosyltransferase family 39 protein [Candidatus Micrarchaeota archaeon]